MSQGESQEEFDGQGESLDEAADVALQKAKDAGIDAGWFTITRISVRFKGNPVKEYKITITPGG